MKKRKFFLLDMANSAKLLEKANGFRVNNIIKEQPADFNTLLIYQVQVMISRYKLWRLPRENLNVLKYNFTHTLH